MVINYLNEKNFRKQYRDLSKKYHPDFGGNEDVMKTINAEYAFLLKTAINAGESVTENGTKTAQDFSEKFNQILDQIVALDSIEIEICGDWIWVSGDTRKHKDTLKRLGFFYAFKKQQWYYREKINKRYNRNTYSMDQIRATYGSEKIENKNKKVLANF